MNSEKLKKMGQALLCAWLLLVCFLWFQVALNAPYSGDDGYYLYSANLYFQENLTPIKDFTSHYSPGYIYLISFIWSLLGQSYTALLFSIFFLALVSTCFMSATLKTTIQKLLFASIFLPVTLIYDGGHPYLEVFGIPFVTAAYFFFKKFKSAKGLLLTGLFFGLALMIKQTFITLLPAFALAIYLDSKDKKIKSLVSFSLSLSLPFLFFCALTQLNVFDTAHYIMSFAHEKYNKEPASIWFSIKHYFQFPVLSYSLFLSFIWALRYQFKKYHFEIIAITIATLPCMMQPFHHYALLLFPWACILWTHGTIALCHKFNQCRQQHHLKPKHLVTIMTSILAIGIFLAWPYIERFSKKGMLFNTFYGGLQIKQREYQYKKGEILHELWQGHGDLYVFGNVELQHIAKIKLPKNRATVGFFNLKDNKIQLEKLVKNQPSVVIFKSTTKRSAANLIPFFFSYDYKIVDVKIINASPHESLVLMQPTKNK